VVRHCAVLVDIPIQITRVVFYLFVKFVVAIVSLCRSSSF